MYLKIYGTYSIVEICVGERLANCVCILPSLNHPNFIYKFSHSSKRIFDLSTINPTNDSCYTVADIRHCNLVIL